MTGEDYLSKQPKLRYDRSGQEKEKPRGLSHVERRNLNFTIVGEEINGAEEAFPVSEASPAAEWSPWPLNTSQKRRRPIVLKRIKKEEIRKEGSAKVAESFTAITKRLQVGNKVLLALK